jgi:enoyl-[acyl-carrier protein] reductase/trans-2-enoyl-CoA reductase (NAD+)
MIALDQPRARGLFVLTAHPEGCRVLAERQIERARKAFPEPLAEARGKTALVIGSTTFGYGSSTAIALRAAGFEKIIGLGYETLPTFRNDKPAIASAGWYLTHALHEQGAVTRSYFADGFADATRDRVIADLQEQGEKIDLLLYSVAAPRRSHLEEEWTSSLLVLGDPLEAIGLDYKSGEHKPVRVEAASELQVEHTRRVMGGDDLDLWANALLYSGAAADGMKIASLSYIGPDFEALRRIYWDGALGAAKKHVDATTRCLDARLQSRLGGNAFTVMNPAVVTGASVAIPAMTKYIADYLGVVDSGVGSYDDPLEVGVNFTRALYGDGEPWKQMRDEEGRLRLDQGELVPEVQKLIQEQWLGAELGPATGISERGLAVFKREFLHLYGWEVEGVDYSAPCEWEPELGDRVADLLPEA